MLEYMLKVVLRDNTKSVYLNTIKVTKTKNMGSDFQRELNYF